jgi:hypothetical protein
MNPLNFRTEFILFVRPYRSIHSLHTFSLRYSWMPRLNNQPFHRLIKRHVYPASSLSSIAPPIPPPSRYVTLQWIDPSPPSQPTLISESGYAPTLLYRSMQIEVPGFQPLLDLLHDQLHLPSNEAPFLPYKNIEGNQLNMSRPSCSFSLPTFQGFSPTQG